MCGIFVTTCGIVSCGMKVGTCWIYVPDQGLNPGPLHWECGVLTTEPPRKSHHVIHHLEVPSLQTIRPHFHFALGPASLIASPGLEGQVWLEAQERPQRENGIWRMSQAFLIVMNFGSKGHLFSEGYADTLSDYCPSLGPASASWKYLSHTYITF